MARVIAIVTELSGKFFAKDAKGNSVELQKGDEIFEGMIVYGDSANGASDTIHIHAYSGEEIMLASNQEQLFDVTMVDEEIADLDAVIAEESIAAIIAENTPQKTQEEEEEDIFEEETAAGDEKAKKDADVAGDFAARDGNMADVNSDLRDARFKVQSSVFEIKSRFEREDDNGFETLRGDETGTFGLVSRPESVVSVPLATFETTENEKFVANESRIPSVEVQPEPTPEPTPTPAPTPPPPPPSTIIKVVAADENGDPLKDAEGNYLEANEMPEGGAVYYVALAFRPNTTVFNDATKLDTQAGTVDFIFTNATASGNDYTPQAGITGIELGTAVKADALDDYLSDNGETFNVAIGNYIPPSPTQYPAVTISNANVVTTITDNPASIDEADTGIGNDDPTNGNYGEEDTVYAIIEGPASVNEGDTTTNYTVKLVDKDANPVTVTQDTDITITYTNDTTQNGDTEHNNNDTITVTITANSASNTFTVDTVDDPYKDDGEKYNLAITNVQNTGEFENVKIGDSNGDYKDVTTTINDDTTPATETDADTTKIVLVAVDDPSVVNSVNDLPVDANGVLIIDNDNITSEGGTFYYIPVAVDAEGKVLATQSGEVDLTYTDVSTTQGTDYDHTVTTTATIGTVFSVDALANDATGEQTENFTVTISNPQNTPYESPQIDTDNDTVTSTIDGRVYVKIINDDTQFEGHDLTHTVVLTDVHGNPITANVPAGETITVNLVFKNVTTEDDDTDHTNNQSFQITVDAGEKQKTITIGSFDDFVVEGDETYTIEITNVAQSNGSYESVKVIDAQKSVTGTIKDGVSLGTPENAAVDEDDFDITDSSSTITKTESLNITAPSGDNAYELLFDGAPTFSSDDGSYTELTSNGTKILYDTSTNGKIIGYLQSGNSTDDKVFEITLDKNNAGGGDDSYTYTQFKNIDHPTANVDDDIVFTFGYKISDQGRQSSVETFTVTVNDSLPSSENQNVNVDEDGSKVIVISDESFAGGSINLDNGVDGASNVANGGSIDIYDEQANDVVGTLTNNGDGTLTFTPTGDYSGATAGFSYSGASDTDGDSASANVSISVVPKSDAPTIANGGAQTNEDTAVTINLYAPLVKDNTDQNNGTAEDYPEKLGLISLYNMTSGVALHDQNGTHLWTSSGTGSKLYILLSDGAHTQDIIDSFTADANHVAMTTVEFEALKVNPVAQSHKDIDIKMDVTSYEVDANGNRLDNAETVGTNGSKTTKTFHVEVTAVTDAIALEFDTATNGSISQTHRANDTFTHDPLNEGDNTIDLKAILSATAGGIVDLDQSENMSYKFEGVPEGTVITLGSHTATANASGEATIWFWANDYIADPQLSMKLPEQYSGPVNATLTLTAKDTDNDSSVTTETKTQVLYFNVDVAPIADIATLQVAQAFGYEDAGRSGGNTDAMNDTIDQPASGIALDIKVSSDDKDGSETFTVRISDIPNDAKIYYDGVEQIINSGEIIISNFNNDAPLYFIPPHNSDSDYTLKVNAQTVDGTSEWNGTWLTVTDKDMKVVVKDVADVPVGTELKDSNGYAYEAVENDLDDNGNSFDLKEVYQTPDDLNSYDSDSETLSIVLSSLPSGFGVEGASLIGNGVWTFLADNINNVKITTPVNFSGEATFNLKYVTTEEAGDSKTHSTDTVKIFVSPSAEATVGTATTASEDVLTKVDFSIAHQNGDTDETLEEIRIKVDDVEGKDFTLYLGSDGSTTLANAGLNVVGGYYILTALQANNVYALNTTQHEHGSYTFVVGYTVRDTENDKNTYDEITGTINYGLTISALTDIPTVTLETINGGTGYSVSGNTVSVSAEDTTFTVPVKLTSPDMDGSENVTQYLITGVPMGVEVAGGTYYGYAGSVHNGIWVLDINDTAISDASGHTESIQFKVNYGADYETRNITIEAFNQDSGASEESDSVTFILEKTYTATGGVGTPPEFTLSAKEVDISEDVAFNLGSALGVTKTGGGLSGGFAVTITDLPEGSSVSGHSYSYVENGVTRYVITSTGGNAADVEAALSHVSITPPANINDSDSSTQSMTFTATIATYHNGTFYSGNTLPYSEHILPITDDMTIAINASAINEDVATNFTITLSNDADTVTEIIGGKLYIKVTENYEAGETDLGSLEYQGSTLVAQSNPDGLTGDYFVIDISNYTMGIPLSFTFNPGDNRHGNVTIEAVVKNKEGHGWDTSVHDTAIQISTDSTTIAVNPVIDGFDAQDVSDSIGNESSGTDLNKIRLDINATLSDPSESLASATLDKIPNGFLIYFGPDADHLTLATNTGTNGSDTFVINPNGDNVAVSYNQWLIPLTSGALPAHIWIQAPQNWSGVLDDVILNLFGLSDGGVTTNESHTFDVTFTPVADGVTIDPTLTFGKVYDWVDLKLNANMEDVDGSEKMNLEISGLDAMAQFRLSDGSGVDATFANNTWTLQNVSYDQINNIQLLHDTSVDNVGLKAWTVDSTSESSSVTDTFTLTLSNVTGELTLPSGAGLDFDKVDALSSLSAIDTINLGAQGANSLQNLTLADVVAITSNSNDLVIDGDSADSVTFKAGETGWVKGASDGTYTTYTNTTDASVTLKIDDDIQQPIM